jgi:hypothetical protein
VKKKLPTLENYIKFKMKITTKNECMSRKREREREENEDRRKM